MLAAPVMSQGNRPVVVSYADRYAGRTADFPFRAVFVGSMHQRCRADLPNWGGRRASESARTSGVMSFAWRTQQVAELKRRTHDFLVLTGNGSRTNVGSGALPMLT